MTNIKKIEVKPILPNYIELNSSSSSSTASNSQILNNLNQIQSVKNDVVNFDRYIGSKDSFDNSANNGSNVNIEKSNDDNNIVDLIKSTAATKVVTKTKILLGIYDVVEHIGDGVLWTGGKIVEGSSFCLAQIAGIFDKNSKKSILEQREDAKDWIKDIIAINVFDEVEDTLFNTKIGKVINDASDIKHDSKTANTIENVTKVGTEIAAATAATVTTGGAASPTLIAAVGGLGFAEGAGKQAQKTYQKLNKTTGAQEAGIMFSGLEGATRWYAYGRLGTGAISAINQAGEIAAHGAWTTRFGSSDTIRGSLNTLWDTRRRRDVAKYLLKSIRGSVTSFTDVVDMSNGVFGTLADSLNNGDMSIGETGGRIAVGLVQNVVINTGVNRVDFLGESLRTPEFIDSLDKRIVSLTKTLIKTTDAAEDSGVVPFDVYDIGKNIGSSNKERSN